MLTFNWDALNHEELTDVLGAADAGKISYLTTDYLLEYAAEDTDITWNFYQHILVPALDKFTAYADYHKEYMVSAIIHNVVQQLTGVWIDKDYMMQYQEYMLQKQQEQLAAVFACKEIRDGIDSFNAIVLANLTADEPEVKYHKIPERRPEPNKFTKEGHVSRNWKAWYTKEEEIARLTENPEPLPRYVKFLDKVKDFKEKLSRYPNLTKEELKTYGLFNIVSPDDKGWLLYEALKFPVIHYTKSKNPDAPPKASVDAEALRGMGEVGRLLIALQDTTKELQAITSLLGKLYDGDIFHPQFKVPGTFTGRLSGDGGFNMQTLPKTAEFLEAFKPRAGHKIVDIDVSGLEDVVLAELSRDKGKLSLFGPDASPYQDGYMYVGANSGELGKCFIEAGYNPNAPTKEGTANAKKLCKLKRNAFKSFVLASNYGAGVNTKYRKLISEGHDVTLDDVKLMHTAYWNVFGGVKDYERKLVAQAEKNGGWFVGGMGFPICICADKMKDILNRQIQNTGHTILTFLQKQIATDLAEAKIPYRPYVWDYHDEVIIEVPDSCADRAFKIMSEAFTKLNKTLQDGNTLVKFKGSGDVMYSIAEAKVEDYKSIWRENK